MCSRVGQIEDGSGGFYTLKHLSFGQVLTIDNGPGKPGRGMSNEGIQQYGSARVSLLGQQVLLLLL